jgi:hypothetical protein
VPDLGEVKLLAKVSIEYLSKEKPGRNWMAQRADLGGQHWYLGRTK